MDLISYEEFGRLRIRDFFPETIRLFLDKSGSTECAIGPAATEGLAFTYFAWRSDGPQITAEVALDFREECPIEVGEKILEAIKLPIRPGMTVMQLKLILGQPETSKLSTDNEGFIRFVCGSTWPYYVGCYVTKARGLTGAVVFRKDYWHPDR